MAKEETVIFVTPIRNLNIRVSDPVYEEGRLVANAKIACFVNGRYETSDKKEISWLRKCDLFGRDFNELKLKEE